MASPLYKDKFVTVDSEKLVINLFYFPYGNKHVALHDIKQLEKFSGWTKSWGSVDLHVWWACDLFRNSNNGHCFAVNGTAGFSVERPDEFEAVLRKAMEGTSSSSSGKEENSKI